MILGCLFGVLVAFITPIYYMLGSHVGGFLRIIYGLGFIGIIALIFMNPFFIAYIPSMVSGEPSIVIFFPDPVEVFNRSLDNYTYYAEVWAVVPDGVVEVARARVGPGIPMLRLTARDLGDVIAKWLEFYKAHGKYWRPALITQFSAYDPYNRSSILAFGASIVYDPEFFASPSPRSEIHKLSIKNYPLIKIFGPRNLSTSGMSLSPCNISLQGLPPPCSSQYDCDCCIADGGFPYFTRLVLGSKIFDSSDPSIPEALRDKVPLVILYLDPNAQTRYFAATYEAQNVNKWIFRMTIFDRSTNKTIWGDASGELTSKLGGAVTVFPPQYRIGMLYWSGSFKLYTAYGYTCCYERLCSGQRDIAVTCDPNGFSALLMIVTYAGSGLGARMFTLDEAPLDIAYFRSKLAFTQYFMPVSSYTTIQRDPYELRINPVNIAMAIILSMLKVPWQVDALLSLAAEHMPIAVEIVGYWGMYEVLRLYNSGGYPAVASVARIQAVYIDPYGPLETFTPIFIDVR